MLTFLEIQREMREAILAAPSREFLDAVVSDRIPARRRLNVYRNHFRDSLTQGLAEVFPATRKLVGDRYFDAMAGFYVAAHPPRDARICRYGHDFPRFLSAREELEDSPYASEVARLEWALAELRDAPDAPDIDWNEFERTSQRLAGAIRLRFAPSVVLFDSDWPVHEIRARTLAGSGADGVAPLVASGNPTLLLLHRDPDGDACELAMDEAGFAALRLLRAGRSVNQASRAALARIPGYPISDLFQFLFQAGLVAGLSPIPASHRDIAKEI